MMLLFHGGLARQPHRAQERAPGLASARGPGSPPPAQRRSRAPGRRRVRLALGGVARSCGTDPVEVLGFLGRPAWLLQSDDGVARRYWAIVLVRCSRSLSLADRAIRARRPGAVRATVRAGWLGYASPRAWCPGGSALACPCSGAVLLSRVRAAMSPSGTPSPERAARAHLVEPRPTRRCPQWRNPRRADIPALRRPPAEANSP